MKTIAVTGTPGTGKTTIAKKLAKRLDFYYLDVNRFIKRNKLYEGYDKRRKTKIVDVRKLNKALMGFIKFFKNKNIENASLLKARSTRTLIKLNIKKITNIKKNKQKIKGIIIDSHLSHYLPRRYVDFCIVAKCDIKELNKRLKNKKFNKNKIQENLQSEIFDICHNEAIRRKHKVIIADTAKSFNISSLVRQLGG